MNISTTHPFPLRLSAGCRPHHGPPLSRSDAARFFAGEQGAAGAATHGRDRDEDGAKEEGESLLDRTVVLYGSSMGSANAHSNVNLPVMIACGGFKHGQHLAFDTKKNYPPRNLYVSMLQRMGIESGEFSTAKQAMTGLEMT